MSWCSTSTCRNSTASRRCRCLLQKKRDLVVIMVSTLTRRSAEISLRALALGAADYIPKPETARETTTSVEFRRELIEKIRTLGRHRLIARLGPRCRAGRLCRRSRARQAPAPRGRKERTIRVRNRRGAIAAVRAHAAARAVDRLVDRRTASAYRFGRKASRRDRPGAGPDHPAHAADIHDRAGRTFVAHRRPRRA